MDKVSVLQNLDAFGLISKTAKKLRIIVGKYFADLFDYNFTNPSKFVEVFYKRYLNLPENERSNSMNGSIFKLLLLPAIVQTFVHFIKQQRSLLCRTRGSI